MLFIELEQLNKWRKMPSVKSCSHPKFDSKCCLWKRNNHKNSVVPIFVYGNNWQLIPVLSYQNHGIYRTAGIACFSRICKISQPHFWCEILQYSFLQNITKISQISKVPQEKKKEKSSTPSEIYDIYSQVSQMSHVFLTFKLWSWSILLLIFYNRTAYCITASSDFTAQLLQLTCKICSDSAVTAPQPKKSGCSRVE